MSDRIATEDYVDAEVAGAGGVSEDFVWALFPGDKPPASPGALDDEFDDASFTGWTGRNSPGSVTEGDNAVAVMACAAQTGTSARIYEKTVSGNFDIRAKLFHGTRGVNYYEAGLFVVNNGNSRIMGLEQAFSASAPGVPAVQVIKLTNATTFSAAPYSEDIGIWPYFRIRSDGTTIFFYCSMDGVTWGLQYSETLATFITTIDRVGFGMNPSHNLASEMSIHWFRSV